MKSFKIISFFNPGFTRKAFLLYILIIFSNLPGNVNCKKAGNSFEPNFTDFHGYEQPNGCRDNTFRLNFYLPLHGTANFFRTTYFFRSNLSSSLVLGWNINNNDCSQAEMQSFIADFKRLTPYYYGDYYPLTKFGNRFRNNTGFPS